MVLPEIEEESEDLDSHRHAKLSLTSLLLGKIAALLKLFIKPQF